MKVASSLPNKSSDQTLSEQFLQDDRLEQFGIIFKRNGLDLDSELKISFIVSEIDEIEASKSLILLSEGEKRKFNQFATEHPSVKLNCHDLKQLVSKILSDFDSDSKSLKSSFSSLPVSSRTRRTSLLSERAKFAPLPDAPALGASPFKRPESPSSLKFTFDRPLSSSFASSNSPSIRTSLDFEPGSYGGNFRNPRPRTPLVSASFSNLAASNVNNLFDASESRFGRSPSVGHFRLSPEPLGDHSTGTRQLRRAASALSRQLEKAEGNINDLADESKRKIGDMESKVLELKKQLNAKNKEIFDLRSAKKNHLNEISTLNKENDELKNTLFGFKKSYFSTKKQHEDSKALFQKQLGQSKNRVHELEALVNASENLKSDYQLLAVHYKEALKNNSILEKDVEIAQSVAKNYDEVIQENFRLKQTVETFERTLAESFSSAQASNIGENTLGNSLQKELENLAIPQYLNPAFDMSRSSSSGLSGFNPTTKQLREQEKENKYLKRHIERCWSQWDRAKEDLVDLSKLLSPEEFEANRKSISEIISLMEKNRPAKSFPNFQRTSIQNTIIDDRPFLSPTDLSLLSKFLNESLLSVNSSPQEPLKTNDDKAIHESQTSDTLSENIPTTMFSKTTSYEPLSQEENEATAQPAAYEFQNEAKNYAPPIPELQNNLLNTKVKQEETTTSINISVTKNLDCNLPASTSYSSTNSFQSIGTQSDKSGKSADKGLSPIPEASTTRSSFSEKELDINNLIAASIRISDFEPFPRPTSSDSISSKHSANGSFTRKDGQELIGTNIASFGELLGGESSEVPPILSSAFFSTQAEQAIDISDPSLETSRQEYCKDGISGFPETGDDLISPTLSNHLSIGDLSTSPALVKQAALALEEARPNFIASLVNKENWTTLINPTILYYLLTYILNFVYSQPIEAFRAEEYTSPLSSSSLSEEKGSPKLRKRSKRGTNSPKTQSISPSSEKVDGDAIIQASSGSPLSQNDEVENE